jgi:hypothetical protein
MGSFNAIVTNETWTGGRGTVRLWSGVKVESKRRRDKVNWVSEKWYAEK